MKILNIPGALLTLSLLSPDILLAECSLLVQKTTDYCTGASPSAVPSCFYDQEISCAEKAGIESFLNRTSESSKPFVVTKSELFRYFKQAKTSEYTYYTLQNLESRGYREEAPVLIGEGSKEKLKSNFRLAWQHAAGRYTALLRKSALQKQFLSSTIWDQHLRDVWPQTLNEAFEAFSEMTTEEEAEFSSELQSQLEKGRSLWSKSSSAGQAAFFSSRMTLLNKRLEDVRKLRAELPLFRMDAMANDLLTSLDSSEKELDQLPCAHDDKSCLSSVNLNPYEKISHRVETLAKLSMDHLEVLKDSHDELVPPLTQSITQEPLVLKTGKEFVRNRDSKTLGIFLASLWPETKGREAVERDWLSLTNMENGTPLKAWTAHRLLDSNSVRPLSCQAAETARVELASLENKLRQSYENLARLEIDLNDEGQSAELVNELLEDIKQTTDKKHALSKTLHVNADRILQVVWDLTKIPKSPRAGAIIHIDWLQLKAEDIPWRPKLTAPWKYFDSSIHSLSTDSEGFDDYGTAIVGPDSRIELALAQNVSVACVKANIRIAASYFDEDGRRQRIFLTTQ